MKKQRGFSSTELLTVLVYASIVVGCAIGWIANIVKLAGSTIDDGGMVILRVIGVFVVPLGVVLGFL